MNTWSLPSEKILSRDDMRRILAAARRHGERDYTFIALAANTGLRLCEIAHLMADDVQPRGLLVMRRKRRLLRHELIDTSPAIDAILQRWLRRVEYGYLFAGNSSPCWIMRTKTEPEQVCVGGHITTREMQRRWNLAIDACGLAMPGRGIHSTRHYAITQFYAKHRDLRAAQLFAGHSSSTITERYASIVDMRDKIARMEATL